MQQMVKGTRGVVEGRPVVDDRRPPNAESRRNDPYGEHQGDDERDQPCGRSLMALDKAGHELRSYGVREGPCNNPTPMSLSVVVPLYQEAAVIPELIARLTRSLDSLDFDWEAILVDDGSTDETWTLLREAALRDDRIRAIRLTRNFGHQAALTAGLRAAEGEAVVTMDGDLQHPPEVVPAL